MSDCERLQTLVRSDMHGRHIDDYRCLIVGVEKEEANGVVGLMSSEPESFRHLFPTINATRSGQVQFLPDRGNAE